MQIAHHKMLTNNGLKLIAIWAMFLDHFSVGFITNEVAVECIRTLGRVAAPIMCFFIANGYYYTSNLKKYATRLFIFALISHVPFVLFFQLEWWQGTSVIWGLFMGLMALIAVKRTNISLLTKLIMILFYCLLSWTADWNFIGVLWIVCFGIFHHHRKLQMLSFVVIGSVFYVVPGLISSGDDALLRFGTFLAIPLLCWYSGKQGKQTRWMKWGFYIFYPAHLLLFFLLKYYII